jgi:hypothetical protein
MADTKDQCSSYEQGRQVCRDGFPVSATCIGVKCFSCGRHSDDIPACQREDLGPRWLDDDGKPRYARTEPEGGKK